MIIAFGRRKRVGKDTAAKFLLTWLRTHTSLDCTVVGITDPIKAVACYLYGWAGVKPAVYYENHPEEKEIVLPTIGKSPRQTWIDIGDCITDHVYLETWARNVVAIPNRIVIVKDLRRPLEANLFKANGGWNVEIENSNIPPSTDAIDRLLEGYKFDKTIDNSGSLNQLHEKIITLGKEIVQHVGA